MKRQPARRAERKDKLNSKGIIRKPDLNEDKRLIQQQKAKGTQSDERQDASMISTDQDA